MVDASCTTTSHFLAVSLVTIYTSPKRCIWDVLHPRDQQQ